MDSSNLLTAPAPRNPARKRRLYSLEGLPWPTAWEKHRQLAEALEEPQEGRQAHPRQ